MAILHGSLQEYKSLQINVVTHQKHWKFIIPSPWLYVYSVWRRRHFFFVGFLFFFKKNNYNPANAVGVEGEIISHKSVWNDSALCWGSAVQKRG